MKEYKLGKEHKQNAFLVFILLWIMASFFVYAPIFYFIKYGEIFEDSIDQIIFVIVYWFILIGIQVYEIYRMCGIKAKIDSEQIIYTNRRSIKTIPFNDVYKMKFTFFLNRSSIKVYTDTQKVRIYLVFQNAYEFIVDMKQGLDASGKSDVYSYKKLFKFTKMIFNVKIMQQWGVKCSLIMIVGLILIFSFLSITTATDANIIVAISSSIIIMLGFYIPIFKIQNRYKKEINKENFYFPPRDMEYERTIMKKAFIIFVIFIAVVIASVMIG